MDDAEIGRRLRRALARHQAGDLETAAAGYRDVLALDAEQADALHLLGVIADQQGRPAEAVELIRRAIRRNPNEAGFHGNLGNALLGLQQTAEAELAYHAALALDPAQAEWQYNLANILRERGAVAEAEAAFRAALAIEPQYIEALHNLAVLYWEERDAPEADALFRQALALAPRNRALRMHYGLYCLGRDVFDPGWELYESRWRSGRYDEIDWGEAKPLWRGEALEGRHLLLWGEQGVGDQILYGTMLREAITAAQRGALPGHVSVAVSDRLIPLFRRALADLDVQVRARPGAAATADLQCPFASLGTLFRRNALSFAGHDGAYLQADSAMRDMLRQRYQAWARPGDRLIGLSWRSTNPKLGAAKSIPLAEMAPLFAVPGITWISVQYGDMTDEIAAAGAPLHVDPAIDSLRDLDAFAAQLTALDGLVSVSNSAVHMAGALGLPCDLMLARGPGRLWYWPRPDLSDSSQSRWYRSLKLWHQAQPGRWGAPLSALKSAISN